MKIDLKRSISGQTLRVIRDLFRRYERYPVDATAAFLKIPESDAATLLDELVIAGFLERDDEASARWKEPIYQLTDAGIGLRNTSALKRIPRAKADQIVAQLVRCAEEINSDGRYVYYVEQISAFGSYIGEGPDLGDIDVAIAIELRPTHKGRIVEANRARAKASGKRLSFIETICYGQTEVRRRLKQVSRHLSIHDISELEELKTERKLLYRRS